MSRMYSRTNRKTGMRLKNLLIAGSLALSCLAAEQAGTIGGPKLGYALDPAIHALRPILGIAGASTLGDPIDVGFAIQDAVTDGQQGYVLAIEAGSQRPWLIFPDQAVPATPLPITGQVEAVYVSPQGVAAAFVMRDSRIEIITGITNGAFVVHELLLGRRPERRPRALAVSDNGNSVVAAFGNEAPLFLGLDGTRLSLRVPGITLALAYRPSSSDVLSASEDNRVWLTQQNLQGLVSREIAGPDDGISTPAALTFTADGNLALIANSGNASVSVADVAAGGVSSSPCGCKPTRFERLGTSGMFRLNDPSGQPMYLFDVASRRALFIPPLLSNPLQGQQN
jgi:hypothetical protein